MGSAACTAPNHVPVRTSPHPHPSPSHHPLQVAERSLFLWNNEYIVQLVAQHRETVLPLVIGALEHNAKHHWNPAVHRCAAGLPATAALYLPHSLGCCSRAC